MNSLVQFKSYIQPVFKPFLGQPAYFVFSKLSLFLVARITGSADLMAGRAAEGLLPGSLATGRPPAWGLNAVSAVSNLTLPDLISQAQWNPGESCILLGTEFGGWKGAGREGG